MGCETILGSKKSRIRNALTEQSRNDGAELLEARTRGHFTHPHWSVSF